MSGFTTSSGEVWRRQVQLGQESVPGSAVSASRIAYADDFQAKKDLKPTVHKFTTGTRDNVRAVTFGPSVATGTAKMPVSADEMLEWLGMTLQGGVTPTTPSGATNARLWSFQPSTTLDSATVEYFDGSNAKRLLGTRCDQMHITGSTNGDNTATFSLFATDRDDTFTTLTPSLTSRTPTFELGWQTRMYIDTFGTTPGTTMIPDALLNWDIKFAGNLGRVFTAANTQTARAISQGELDITAKLTLAGQSATAASELANWLNHTARIIRLEFGHNVNIDAGTNAVQTLSISGAPTGGTFTLTFWGFTTAPIAYNATAAAVQSALQALPSVGTGNVTCTGGPLPGSSVIITFGGSLSSMVLPLITANSGGLTGGTSPTASVAATTAGADFTRKVMIDLPGVWVTPDLDQTDNSAGAGSAIRAYAFNLQYQYDTTNGYGMRVQCQSRRTALYSAT